MRGIRKGVGRRKGRDKETEKSMDEGWKERERCYKEGVGKGEEVIKGCSGRRVEGGKGPKRGMPDEGRGRGEGKGVQREKRNEGKKKKKCDTM